MTGTQRHWVAMCLAILMAVLFAGLAYGATTNGWGRDPTGTGDSVAQRTQIVEPGCRWLNMVAGDTAGTFSAALIIAPMTTTKVYYDPDTTSDLAGGEVNIHACLHGGAAVGAGCSFLGKDRDGDGSIDLVPLDGTPGYTAMSFAGPVAAIVVEVVTANAAHSVRVCSAR